MNAWALSTWMSVLLYSTSVMVLQRNVHTTCSNVQITFESKDSRIWNDENGKTTQEHKNEV
jgi:hypothetical protein